MTTAKQKFNIHKNSAKSRGIDFNLTFDQWNNWWLSNGIDKNYATDRTKNSPCMCRFNDVGPYELGNIYCDTNSNNRKLSMALLPRLGDKHPMARTTITPIGSFTTCNAAAKALGIRRQSLYELIIL